MKQVFNPAVTAEVGEQLRETVSGFQSPPKPPTKKVVEGIEIRSDLCPPPLRSPRKQGDVWSRIYKAMKVGEAAVFVTRKEAANFRAWGSWHKYPLLMRAEKGKFYVFRVRKTKTRKGGK